MDDINKICGNRLKECREQADETIEHIGSLVGVHKSTVSRWEQGQTKKIPLTVIDVLAKHFNVNAAWLSGKNVSRLPSTTVSISDIRDFDAFNLSKEVIRIPVLGQVAAGIPMYATENIIDYEEISVELSRTGNFFGLKIKGDSMEPLILNGDTVIVRQQTFADDGEIAIVLVNGDVATCKKIKKRPEGVMLISNNSSYDPMFYSNEEIENLPIRVIGVVVELRRSFL